ncbi:MAG TPA: dihydroorotase family protein [Candidatus Saccharimonadales bacterium]|nr:dihydroorotase family protein [Candidatus Saccharimonadales bacterium]
MGKIITLPGLIDLHVHLRDPWQLQKEDFYTGTSAALAGGFVKVFDMPNNEVHITTSELIDRKIASARKKAVADIGFYFSSLGAENISEFEKVFDKVCGLKLFITTTTNMQGARALNDLEELVKICKAWPAGKPILFHAEDHSVNMGVEAAKRSGKRIHFCHISGREELEPILAAKREGLPITFGVTPHHLFLTVEDKEKLGQLGNMLPSLKTRDDQDFLWGNLDNIDVFESDHAPHTLDEKVTSHSYGVPGLETTLSLMLTAERDGKLTRKQLLEKLYYAPAKILGLTTEEDSKIEVDMSEYEIKNEDLKTKCGWSPFAGRRVVGKVKKTYIRGELVYEDGDILAKPGSGRIIS